MLKRGAGGRCLGGRVSLVSIPDLFLRERSFLSERQHTRYTAHGTRNVAFPHLNLSSSHHDRSLASFRVSSPVVTPYVSRSGHRSTRSAAHALSPLGCRAVALAPDLSEVSCCLGWMSPVFFWDPVFLSSKRARTSNRVIFSNFSIHG